MVAVHDLSKIISMQKHNDDVSDVRCVPGQLLHIDDEWVYKDAMESEIFEDVDRGIAMSLGVTIIDERFDLEMMMVLTVKGIGWMVNRERVMHDSCGPSQTGR